MRTVFKLLRSLFLLVLVAGIALVAWWLWASAPVNPSSKATVRFTVSPGDSPASLGRQLEKQGLIRSARAFRFLGRQAEVHPGVYDISASETPFRILRHMQRGDFAKVRLTIPEGFTLRQIAHRLFHIGAIDDEKVFYDLVTEQGNTFKASVPLPTNLEGYLFPETYSIPVGATDAQIAQTMLESFDRRVALPYAAEIKASGRSLPTILNVAAMVESEAETDEDRAPIAGVIYNRVARGMKLQIDATVQYAQGFHKTRLLFRDLTIDSPYNTYKIKGLPPTPICNPGLPSIVAAIHPAVSEYFFYVQGPNHSHIFAKTFAEHEKNIALVHRLLKNASDKSPAASDTP